MALPPAFFAMAAVSGRGQPAAPRRRARRLPGDAAPTLRLAAGPGRQEVGGLGEAACACASRPWDPRGPQRRLGLGNPPWHCPQHSLPSAHTRAPRSHTRVHAHTHGHRPRLPSGSCPFPVEGRCCRQPAHPGQRIPESRTGLGETGPPRPPPTAGSTVPSWTRLLRAPSSLAAHGPRDAASPALRAARARVSAPQRPAPLLRGARGRVPGCGLNPAVPRPARAAAPRSQAPRGRGACSNTCTLSRRLNTTNWSPKYTLPAAVPSSHRLIQ